MRYYTHPDCALHEMGAGHPEQPARIRAVEQGLERAGLLIRMERVLAPAVTRDALLRVHPESYIDEVEVSSPASGYFPLDPDTMMNRYTLSAAQRAAGAAVDAVEWAMQGEGRRAFCNVRPPGHHALRNHAMGFCVYATVAVAAKHAVALGAQRVAIVDFDVHHGNGTEACVAGDDRILLCSTFQHPYYPHSGVPSLASNIINVPLAWGSGGAEVRAAYAAKIADALRTFAPQLILISAGFDAHKNDPLAGLNFVEDDYAWLTQQLLNQANVSAGGRVVSCLEGGYDLAALAASAAAHVAVLI